MWYKTGGDFLINTHHSPVSSWTQDRELICVSPCWESWEKILPAQIQIPATDLPPSQIKPKAVKKREKGGREEEGEKFEDQCVLKNKNKSQAASEIPSVQALDTAGTYFSLCLWSVLHGAHLHGDLLKE